MRVYNKTVDRVCTNELSRLLGVDVTPDDYNDTRSSSIATYIASLRAYVTVLCDITLVSDDESDAPDSIQSLRQRMSTAFPDFSETDCRYDSADLQETGERYRESLRELLSAHTYLF